MGAAVHGSRGGELSVREYGRGRGSGSREGEKKLRGGGLAAQLCFAPMV